MFTTIIYNMSVKIIFHLFIGILLFQCINFICQQYFWSSLGIIYSLLLLINYLKLFFRKFQKLNTKKLNFFSLVIPAKNEENNIRKTIDSLLEIDYNPDYFEVIIVNDNSSDTTLSIIQEYKLPNNYKIIDRKRKEGFVAGVLNDGIKERSNKSEIIGIVDSDTLVSSDILTVINKYYDGNFKGGIQPQEWHYNNRESFLTKMQHYLCVYENFQNISNKFFKIGHFFHVDNLKYISYNEESILEDKELSINIKERNEKIYQIDDVLVYRTFHNNIKSIYSQQYRYQLGELLYCLKNDSILVNMLISLIIFFNTISIPYYGVFNFIKINYFLLKIIYLLIFISLNQYYSLSFSKAIHNCPKLLLPIIKLHNTNTLTDVLSAVLFAYFILSIRLLPLFKKLLNIEYLVWNR